MYLLYVFDTANIRISYAALWAFSAFFVVPFLTLQVFWHIAQISITVAGYALPELLQIR